MKKRTPVSEIMSRNVITLTLNDSLDTSESIFKNNKIRHLPVVNGDKTVGMLSYTDLLRISVADALDEEEENVETTVYNMFTIQQVMAKNLVSVSTSTTVKEVAEILAKKEFHALPVIDDNKLVGIVTTTDLINYLIKQF